MTIKTIYQAFFVRLAVPDESIYRFSTHFIPYTVRESDGVQYSYSNLGQLLSISNTSSVIRATPEEITILISGIPLTNIAEFTQQKIKGSSIELRRVVLNPETGEELSEPWIKFKGIVNNYNVTEDWPNKKDPLAKMSASVGLQCTTQLSLLKNKVAGRRTNPLDQKRFYPNDTSMDRVPTITGSSYNFGAPS